MTTIREPWNEKAQIRHAAKCSWPPLFGRDAEYLRFCERLRELGYDGCIDSLDYETIIQAWRQAEWVLLSPDGVFLRLTPKGKEQFEAWNEEERVWRTGGTESMPLTKRLIAGEPAQNIRKIKNVIEGSTVTGIHDPYTRAGSLETLLKLADIGTKFSPSLRILGSPITKATERTPLVGFLRNINSERTTTWEIRTYVAASKPHRRFLVLDDGSIVTCGMSLNHIDKDEVLDRIAVTSEYAKHDRDFFEEKWKPGTIVS
jgi:hypothetical protein